jgi:hypothetical protein
MEKSSKLKMVTFHDALRLLLEKKCDSIQSVGDTGPIVLMKAKAGHGHDLPMLVFAGTGQAMPASYALGAFTINGEKIEMVEKGIINVYVANKAGKIVSGPFVHGTVLELSPGQSTVNVAGVELVPKEKKLVRHILTDVSWHQSKNVQSIERIGFDAKPFFPFYPVGPVKGLISPLIAGLGDKKTTVTIEYEA